MENQHFEVDSEPACPPFLAVPRPATRVNWNQESETNKFPNPPPNRPDCVPGSLSDLLLAQPALGGVVGRVKHADKKGVGLALNLGAFDDATQGSMKRDSVHCWPSMIVVSGGMGCAS